MKFNKKLVEMGVYRGVLGCPLSGIRWVGSLLGAHCRGYKNISICSIVLSVCQVPILGTAYRVLN